jgi:hypothetical protein
VPVQETADEAVEVPKSDPAPQPKPTAPAPATPTPTPKPTTPSSGGAQADNTGTSDTDLGNNQGNAENQVGDAGTQQGSINADAILGGGSGGGAQLSLDGWKWDAPPQVNDGSAETGMVTIRFKIDDEGTVVNAVIASGYTVTPRVAEFYRQYVEQDMSFSPKDNTGKVASYTLGSITFILKSR